MNALNRWRLCVSAAGIALMLATAAPVQAQERPYRQEIIQLVAGDGRIVPAIVTFPRDGMNLNAPAIIHCQGGPGSSPLEGSGPWIADGLARRGYTVIAPLVRHGDTLFTTGFKEYGKDVKAVVDHLAGLGFRQIVLSGSSFGSITSTRYLVDTKDPRVTATIHFAPTEDLGPWVRRGMGDAAYQRAVEEAGDLVASNKLDEIYAPPFSPPPPMPAGRKGGFFSTPEKWLELYGPASSGENLQLFPQLNLPLLMLAGEKDGYNTLARMERLKAAATSSPKVDILYYAGEVDHSFNSNPPVQPKVIADVAAWLGDIGHGVGQRIKTEVITITDREPGTRALRYTPEGGAKAGTAFLAVHDFDGSAFAGPAQWLAEGVAQAGYLSIGMHIMRGSRAMLGARYEASSKEIRAWVDYLAGKGFAKVVLIGDGIGATRVAQYLAATNDTRIGGVVLVEPIANAPALLKAGIGAAPYQQLVSKATAHKASEDWKDFIYLKDVPAGIPINLGPSTLAMMPGAFLDTWGPSAPATDQLLPKLRVPVLVIAAGGNPTSSRADVQRWTKGSKHVEAFWYDSGGEHRGLAGLERRATADLLGWASRAGLVDKAAATLPEVPISTSNRAMIGRTSE